MAAERSGVPNLKGKRVLIVDDSKLFLSASSFKLKKVPHHPHTPLYCVFCPHEQHP